MSLKLHELPADPGKAQKTKRLGRGEGSGRGKTAGKGHKGRQARSGHSKGAAFEGGQMPLIRRLPKFGFSTAKFRAKRAEVTLGQLEKHFAAGATVDAEALAQARLISRQAENIKILATGKLAKALTVRVSGFSAGARAAIEAAGGSCEQVS